jgi:tetratricopeptide (TPR) repeat protein
MSALAELNDSCPRATDGEIAAINLESARRDAWARFARDPRRSGTVEEIVDLERLVLQFLGDLEALDRLEALAAQFASLDDSSRGALVSAEVASTVHRFDDARDQLARAQRVGGARQAIERQSLAIDQACGIELDKVLAERRRIATASGRLEDLVPLGAVLTDLGCFDEADTVYRRGFYSFHGISPFPLAWVCFQLGLLWGELVPVPDRHLAAVWYRRAVAYLPGYVKARVHLAEIYASQNQWGQAEAQLQSALSSRDPEVRWRLADVMVAQGRFEEAEGYLGAARSGYGELLEKHLLAFADHAAEFYASSGNDCRRALELAHRNATNRPTRRAVQQAEEIAGRCP